MQTAQEISNQLHTKNDVCYDEFNGTGAVARAIDECIKEGILVEFLRKNRSEVKMVSILEYDKEWEEKKLRKAEYEAGKLNQQAP